MMGSTRQVVLKTVRNAFLILSIVCFVVAFGLAILKCDGTTILYWNGVFLSDYAPFAFGIGCVFLNISIQSQVFSKGFRLSFKIILTVLSIILLAAILFFCWVVAVFTTYVVGIEFISSPDGNHTVAVIQEAIFTSERVEFYEQDGIVLKIMTTEPSNPGLQAFSPEEETIEWTDDGFWFVRNGERINVRYPS